MGMNIQEGMGQIDSFNGSGCGAAATSGTCTVAIGEDADADGNRTTAIGYRAIANGEGGVAIGLDAQVGLVSTSNMGFAFGFLAEALAHESFTFGSTLQATAVQSMVIGIGTTPYLVNNIPQSLMIGMNSDVPSFFIGDGNNAYSNIGIATTAPLARMHINGTLRLGENAATTPTTGILEFENTTNANVFSITSGATTGGSFGWLLPDAQGGLDEVLTNDGFGGLSWAVPNTSTTAWQLLGNSGTNPTTPDFNFLGTIDNVDLAIRTNDTERMRVMAAGNVGIGTSTPDGLLHLNATNTYMIVEKGIDNEGGVVWHNGPQSAGTANASLMFETDETLRLRNAVSDQNVVINVNDGGTDREAIFVEGTSAHVGIGTVNPLMRLHVVAPAATGDDESIARFAVSDNDTAFIQLENIDDLDGHFAGGIRSISSTAGKSALLIAAAVHPTIDTGSEPMMVFSPRRLGSTNITARPLFEWANNVSSKMRMKADGNLGIGTTTPSGKLHVAGTTFVNTLPGGTAVGPVGFLSSNQLMDLNSSSLHFKQNIEELQFDQEQFLSMQPVSFQWKDAYGAGQDVGFIAQQVAEDFLPLADIRYKHTYLEDGLVLRDSLGLPVVDSTQTEPYGVKYHKLPVYLFMLAKQQESTIMELSERINQLQSMVESCCAQTQYRISDEPIETIPYSNKPLDEFVLLQNDPNPFADYTDIRISMLESTKNASLLIVDMKGTVMLNLKLEGKSETVRVYSSDIGSGVFTYYLLSEGNVVASRKMVSSK